MFKFIMLIAAVSVSVFSVQEVYSKYTHMVKSQKKQYMYCMFQNPQATQCIDVLNQEQLNWALTHQTTQTN